MKWLKLPDNSTRSLKKYVTNFSDTLVNGIFESKFNKKLDEIGHIIQEEYYYIKANQRESMFYRRTKMTLKYLVLGFLGTVVYFDYSQLPRFKAEKDMEHVDYISEYIDKSNNLNHRVADSHERIIQDHLKDGGMDALDWLALGQRFALLSLPDFAYHAYYMAHLKSPQFVKTNSDLKFDTANNPAKSANPNDEESKSGLDSIINNLLEV